MRIISRCDLESWLAREILGCEPLRKPPARARRETPERDWKYRAWIRSLPCCVCGAELYVEAAHTGDHGISQKASDYRAIPLCPPHHRTRADSYHFLGRREFERRHGLDVEVLVKRLNAAWKSRAA